MSIQARASLTLKPSPAFELLYQTTYMNGSLWTRLKRKVMVQSRPTAIRLGLQRELLGARGDLAEFRSAVLTE